MKSIFNLVLFIFLIIGKTLMAQDLKIKDVDETAYPLIKVVLEFPESNQVDLKQLIILEGKDSVIFSIDSIHENTQKKAIFILLSSDILNNQQNIEIALNKVKEILNVLSEGDLINIAVSKDKSTSLKCIDFVSYGFTSDFNGFLDFFNQYYIGNSKADKSVITNCTVNNSIEFLSKSNNLPSQKVLIILSGFDKNGLDSIAGLKNKAKELGIAIYSDSERNENGLVSGQDEAETQQILAFIDSIYSNKPGVSVWNEKLYKLEFYTKQKENLNQFEIVYKGTKLRSTFARPSYIGFFKDNMLLIGIIAFFLLLIIFFIVNLIYTKKQMMQSVRELKTNRISLPKNNDLNLDNFSANKTLYGTVSVTPFLSIEIEDRKSNYELTKMIVKIGRHQENDIVIDNMTISNIHATITIEGGQFFIQDNASTNGTFVNDMKISKKILKNGDSIRLGKARILLTC